MKKKLSICIPVFNKWNFTKACLDDLSKLPNDHEIIVIDNCSNDETESCLKNSTEIVYHRNQTNTGFSKACNKAYSLSSADNVLFLNNDIRVKADKETWTKKIIKLCDYAIVGPTMGQLDKQFNFIQEANRALPGMSYMSGWCIASSKEIWKKLFISDGEVFSEEFGIAYFEDTDLSFRAKELDIPFHIVEIPVVHFGRVTSKQLNTHQLYSNARSIFVKKWEKRIKK